jgi:hypothetical protein
MANRIEECLRKAEQCERAGSFAATLEARLMFYGLAQQWRDVADCFLRKLSSGQFTNVSAPNHDVGWL